jgi:hypothetical protein
MLHSSILIDLFYQRGESFVITNKVIIVTNWNVLIVQAGFLYDKETRDLEAEIAVFEMGPVGYLRIRVPF